MTMTDKKQRPKTGVMTRIAKKLACEPSDRNSTATTVLPLEHRGHGDTRSALLKAAIKVFAQNGFDGTTVKDLADEAGVNVSMVSYYFGGKECLYKTMLENFGLERVSSAERLLKSPRSREEFALRLGLFAENIFEIYAKEPELVRIVHRSIDIASPLTDHLFENVFSRIFLALQAFLDASRELGIIRQDIETDIAAESIFGSLVHFAHCEPLRIRTGGRSIQDPAYVDQVIKTWMTVFTEGLVTRSSNQQESKS